VILGDAVAEGILDLRPENAARRHGVQKILLRHRRHAQYPINGRLAFICAHGKGSVRAAHDGCHISVDLRRCRSIEG
jgi:hypothetical protein